MAARTCAMEHLGNSMRILHIAAHLGGGAGKAISGIAVLGQQMFPDIHRVVLLQAPEKSGYVQVCEEHQISVELWKDPTVLDWADVIVVSWWNHPTMAQFLHNIPPIHKPILLWSHVNGCHYPFLNATFAQTFDRVLLTTPYSLENRTWTPEERNTISGRAEIVYGMGSFQAVSIVPKSSFDQGAEFVVGYAGTLNYGKLHPEFVQYCMAVCERLPNARFVMAGDRDAALERDIQAAGLEDRFTFPGFVPDVPALIQTFDVFGYLLHPEHYGTTENVLLEAMAAGLPVVVRKQNVEQFIVPETAGIHVETSGEYGQALEQLHRNPAMREALGRQAREHAMRQYDAQENTVRFRSACCQAQAGGTHDFSFLGEDAWLWFLYGLDGETRRSFEEARQGTDQDIRMLLRGCPPILREERKSSLRHFAKTYPEDKILKKFEQIMEDL